MRPTLIRGARRRRPFLRGLLAAGAALVLSAGVAGIAVNQANAATGCRVTYTITNQWDTGFGATLSITNLGDPLTSWTLTWDFANAGQRVSQGWNGTFTQASGSQRVTVTNASYNGSVGTNAQVSSPPGFNGTYSGANPVPTSFSLNGTACTGSTTTTPPTTPPTTPTTTPPTTTPPAGTHVDNPFVGGRGYVNPEWAANARADGGAAIANQPTAVWLDRIAAINGVNGGMGLRDHLDEALDQGASYIQIVIYNLPGRDCSALASNGELGPTEIGRYQTEYIDPIAAIMGDASYRDLRIVAIVEIDSLPNLVTNTNGRATQTDTCNTMLQNGNYVRGVQYALNKLHAIPNVYNYVDAGHHGWLGWDDNFGASADLFASTIRGTTAGLASVDGFITNTANYSALQEPFITVTEQTRQSRWIDFNRYVDELSFAQAFRQRLITQNGFSQNIGMLIDTSRNGWGGPNRPTQASTSTDINTFINESRVDRRPHLGDWCNQSGAGIGERPRANPATGIDAYVWVKPPGESDGASQPIDNDEGKGFDQMCDPNYGGNVRNGNSPTGALPNAPLSGHWFPAQFRQLVANAFPPL
ncbi:MAG TPA: glycoside hydrolase family 6 protein [Streptosporangiaceae bacterium]|nr:glycoside hydrolase family 6 protein [Streptosporangiaceae bacterium]